MATKRIRIEGIGEVLLVKSRRSRQLKLSVTSKGVRVSLPAWTPFVVGERFVNEKRDWVQRHTQTLAAAVLQADQRIGKLHTLQFETSTSAQVSSRVTGTKIVVRVPLGTPLTSPVVQSAASAACERALRREAEQILPPRLQSLSEKHALPYRSVSIKKLQRRWGSCDSRKNIVLNLFLTELPWDFIDYVLLHELTHTVHMHHGPDFWAKLTSLQPRARDISRSLRRRQPHIGTDIHDQ